MRGVISDQWAVRTGLPPRRDGAGDDVRWSIRQLSNVSRVNVTPKSSGFRPQPNNLRRAGSVTGGLENRMHSLNGSRPGGRFAGKAHWLVVAITCCILTSCVTVIAHDEKAAAKAATEFAQTAFVARDYSKAHGLLASKSQSHIPIDKLTEAIAKMHPKSYPAKVMATEFEPLPGQRGMNIFVKGDGESEDFFYRLAMEGDVSSGYRVTGLFRGNGPNPSTNKRPLNL